MKELNKEGVFIGTTVSESDQRRVSYMKAGCISNDNKQATPIAIFTEQDKLELIRKHNIPYAVIYDKGESTTGCAYCGMGCVFDPFRFDRVKKIEPKRHEIIMNLENNGVKYKDAIKTVLSTSSKKSAERKFKQLNLFME
jgi:3'-phosphoadenosine 5'-phosphosulfate sulfotransferase (PAPS reductase)/FAD synthetase